MAGIGFELRKVISRGGISSFLSAAFSGTMIVAGPWVISIISISIIQNVLAATMPDDGGLFIAAVIYAYAFSMVLFGGMQYIVTRIFADQLWEKKEEEAVSSMLAYSIPQSIIAIIAGAALSVPMRAYVGNPGLFVCAFTLLFLTVSLLWLCMLFVSILNKYLLILFTYLGGMGLSIGLTFVFSRTAGSAGALLGFALGHASIVLVLMILIVQGKKHLRLRGFFTAFKTYIKDFKMLLATGILYSIGIWIDKIVYWFGKGNSISGGFWHLYGIYDLPVFIANLTMIPGLIYFIISSETAFAMGLKKIILSLPKSRFAEIQRKKYALLSIAKHNLADQTYLHLAVGAGLMFLIPLLNAKLFGGAMRFDILAVTLLGVICHLFFFTLINYSFYLDYFRETALGALLYTGSNVLLSLLFIALPVPILPGTSYAVAGFAASIFMYFLFFNRAKTAERHIFLRILRQ